MPDLPDLSLPDVTRGRRATQWDLKILLYKGGAGTNLTKVNALIDAGQLGKPLIKRLGLIVRIHEILRSQQAMGGSKFTIEAEIDNLRRFFAWADAARHPIEIEEIRQTYLEWTEHLFWRVHVRKDIKQLTAYGWSKSVGSLLDGALDRKRPILHSSRLEKPKQNKKPFGIEADKQNLESTFRFGYLLQDICDYLTLEALWGPLPVRIPLREGNVLEEWCKLKPMTKLISARRDSCKRRYNAKKAAARRASHEGDLSLRTRYPLSNLRIEAELLMFIGQTGMNLAQAHQLQLRQFSYSSYLDGYQVRDYKERRGGPVLFEIYQEYKKHFERYLEWRRHVFKDEKLLFPLVRFGRAVDGSPVFTRIKSSCAKTGIPYVPPKILRNTRVNWLLRRSQDPDLTAEMSQHTKQTLLTVYERPNLQVAISEVTRFWSENDPTLARTTPVAPGECDGQPEPVPGMPKNATQPDCIQRTGCLWCTHHRDIDNQDYVWALACFHHLKVIELSLLRRSRDSIEGHPAWHAVERIHQKMRWYHDSNLSRRSWVEEAAARVEEGSYHPDWVRLIESVEGSQA